MKKKYKIGLAIILLAVIAGSTAIILIKKNKAKQDCSNSDSTSSSNGECKVDLSSISAEASAASSAGLVSQAASATVQPYLYTNDKYGFRMQLDANWSGYRVGTVLEESGAVDVYAFEIPTKDTNYQSGMVNIMTIYVYNKSGQAQSGSTTKIIENSKYTFAYTIWNQAPSDAKLTDKDIANVIASFKLI